MVRDDNVYLGHMLDMSRKAIALVASPRFSCRGVLFNEELRKG